MKKNSQIIRAFVAVPIPEHVKQLAAETGAGLLNSTKELKLVKLENFHLTLAFIGDVETDLLEGSFNALEEFASSMPSIHVEFSRIGSFPSVIYLKTSIGERELVELSKGVRRILVSHELPFDPKPFKGHLTIARLRNRRKKAKEFLKAYAMDTRFRIDFKVESFAVIQSELTARGPIYTTLGEFHLVD